LWKFSIADARRSSVFDVDLRSAGTRHWYLFYISRDVKNICKSRSMHVFPCFRVWKISVSILFPVIHLVRYLYYCQKSILWHFTDEKCYWVYEHNSDTEFTERASSSGLSLSLLSRSLRWLTARFRLDSLQKLIYL